MPGNSEGKTGLSLLNKAIKISIFSLLFLMALSINAQENFSLKVLGALPQRINPSINQQVKIQFTRLRDGQALVRIYDRRAYQVREFSVENIEANKVVTVAWNGKDERGELVPDEAYFFTIEATDIKGNIAEYDSTATLSNRVTPLQSHYDSENNKLHFTVDADAVVDIRSGISDGGPLLTKLIEWKPYLQGRHSIDWDGWDRSHTVHVSSLEKYLFHSQTAPLPEFSMITFGDPEGKNHIYSLKFANDGLKRKSKAAFINNRFS